MQRAAQPIIVIDKPLHIRENQQLIKQLFGAPERVEVNNTPAIITNDALVFWQNYDFRAPLI